jgi:hypothetical protein
METALNLVRGFLEQTSMRKTLKSLDAEIKERPISSISVKDVLNFISMLTSHFREDGKVGEGSGQAGGERQAVSQAQLECRRGNEDVPKPGR